MGRVAEHRHVADARPRQREHQGVPRRVVAGPRHDLHRAPAAAAASATSHARPAGPAGSPCRQPRPPTTTITRQAYRSRGTPDPGIEQRPASLPVSRPGVRSTRASLAAVVRAGPAGTGRVVATAPPLPLPLLPPSSSLSSSPPTTGVAGRPRGPLATVVVGAVRAVPAATAATAPAASTAPTAVVVAGVGRAHGARRLRGRGLVGRRDGRGLGRRRLDGRRGHRRARARHGGRRWSGSPVDRRTRRWQPTSSPDEPDAHRPPRPRIRRRARRPRGRARSAWARTAPREPGPRSRHAPRRRTRRGRRRSRRGGAPGRRHARAPASGSASMASITRSMKSGLGSAAAWLVMASRSRAIRVSAATSSTCRPSAPSSSPGPKARGAVIGPTPRRRGAAAPGRGGGVSSRCRAAGR